MSAVTISQHHLGINNSDSTESIKSDSSYELNFATNRTNLLTIQSSNDSSTDDNDGSNEQEDSAETTSSQETNVKKYESSSSESETESNISVAQLSVTVSAVAPVPAPRVYKLSDFARIKTVGTGTFGRVIVCRDKVSNRFVAMKILAMADVLRMKQTDHVFNERNILAEINHPFMISCEWSTKDDLCLYMMMEYVNGGELFSYLRNSVRFNSGTAKFYSCEIILALEYLHNLHIVYRDLKPENLLLTSTGHIKLTDFGLSKKIYDRTYTYCGTLEYLAPEIVQSKGYNKAVDWWALGILIYEMLVGKPPFEDFSTMVVYEKILQGEINWPLKVNPMAKDLIKKLLSRDRTKRLGNMKNGANDIKNHRWFKYINWDDVYHMRYEPPFFPEVKFEGDTSNFDENPDEDWTPPLLGENQNTDIFADF